MDLPYSSGKLLSPHKRMMNLMEEGSGVFSTKVIIPISISFVLKVIKPASFKKGATSRKIF